MNWEDLDNTYKTFIDPIHGYINMNSLCLSFIDTPQFQRLRNLKQLGTLSYVFSSATHTRFSHSIGVGHLAGNLVNKYKKNQPELNLTNREINLTKIAGLCHDLGHGPFSHVFDNEFIRKKNINFKHENMSIDMLNYLIDDNHIDLEKQDIRFIENSIINNFNKNIEHSYLYDIVANSNNCIDVDKFDYLSRDMHHVFGNTKTYNCNRIYKFNRVIDNNICYDIKVIFDIYELFHQRYNMHREVYNHKKAKSIEYMISDILLYADNVLNISQSINNPMDFINITDDIIKIIELSNDSRLERSQFIIKQLQNRKLYKYIDEYIVPIELIYKIPDINKIDISTNNITHNINIDPDDIIIYDKKINFNLNNKNPVDNVYFYSFDNIETKFKNNKNNISLILPNNYEDRILRIYSRNQCQKMNLAIKLAFRNFLKQFI